MGKKSKYFIASMAVVGLRIDFQLMKPSAIGGDELRSTVAMGIAPLGRGSDFGVVDWVSGMIAPSRWELAWSHLREERWFQVGRGARRRLGFARGLIGGPERLRYSGIQVFYWRFRGGWTLGSWALGESPRPTWTDSSGSLSECPMVVSRPPYAGVRWRPC